MSAERMKEIYNESPDYIKSNPVFNDAIGKINDAGAELVEAKKELDKVKAKKTSMTGYWERTKKKDIKKWETEIELIERYIKNGTKELEKWIEEQKAKSKGGRRRSRRRKRRKSRRKSRRKNKSRKRRRRTRRRRR